MQTDKNQRRTMRFIGFSFLSLVIVLIVVCVFSYIRDKEAQYSNDEKMQVAYQRLELVNELFSNRELSQMLLRTHIHTEGAAGKDSLRHLLQQAHLENRANVKNLEKLLVKPRRIELLHDLSDEQNAYYRASDSLLALSNSGNTAAALSYLDAVLAPLYNHHQKHLIALNKEATISSRRRMDEVISSISSVVDRYALMILLAAVSTAWAAFALNRVFRHLHRENNILNGEIRERKALQAALLESQQQYRRLFDRNPIPMLVYDQHTLRIMEVNEAALQEYGYTRDELLNLTVTDIRPENDTEAFLQRIENLDKTADGSSKGHSHQRKDGSQFKVELWSHALPQQHNAYPRLVVVVNVQERETV
ncbi:MAG: PAS domain S-box protein, partial [Pontibacter sp.]|nr:PAS domain S-box protein [Pontibacter sp.]